MNLGNYTWVKCTCNHAAFWHHDLDDDSSKCDKCTCEKSPFEVALDSINIIPVFQAVAEAKNDHWG